MPLDHHIGPGSGASTHFGGSDEDIMKSNLWGMGDMVSIDMFFYQSTKATIIFEK